MSFNVSDLIVAEEIGLEVARQVPKPELERNNDIYLTAEVPLTIKHDCYSVIFPDHVDSINHIRLGLCASAYKYRINHGEWIDVEAEAEVVEKDFNVESFDISNDIGTGTLEIYFEGLGKNSVGV